MGLKRTLGIGVASLAILGSFVACSSEDDGGGSTAPTSNSNSSAELEQAKVVVTDALAAPAGIGYDQPVAKKPSSDVKAVILENTLPITKRVNVERVAAAKALGWQVSTVPVGNGAEDPAKAMDQALDQKPDVIFEAGYGVAQISAQLQRAEKEGVIVVAQCITDPPGGALIAVDCDATTADQQAQVSAAYIAVNGSGKDKIQLFGTSVFPILKAYDDSFIKWMKVYCPECTVTQTAFQISDIGTKLPQAVVSALQKTPDTNWVVVGFGDALTGVEPALAAAGLSGDVQIGGWQPGPAQYEALRQGTNAFWTQSALPQTGWREADIAVRALAGEDIGVITSTPLPAQLLTPENIDSAVFDDDGFLIAKDNFSAEYKAQWLLPTS